MFGQPNLTVPGSLPVSLDTVRVRAPFGDVSKACEYFDAASVKKGLAYLAVPSSHGSTSVERVPYRFGKSRAGGLAFELGAEQLRSVCFEQAVRRVCAPRIPGDKALWTLPRVDWCVQLVSRDGLRDEVLAVAAHIGFHESVNPSRPAEVIGAGGRTSYRHLSISRRVSASVVRTDELLLRVYDAVDVFGVQYLRVEVQERCCSRRLVSLTPIPVTRDLLSAFAVCDLRATLPSGGAVVKTSARRKLAAGISTLLSALPDDSPELEYLAALAISQFGHVELSERWPRLVLHCREHRSVAGSLMTCE